VIQFADDSISGESTLPLDPEIIDQVIEMVTTPKLSPLNDITIPIEGDLGDGMPTTMPGLDISGNFSLESVVDAIQTELKTTFSTESVREAVDEVKSSCFGPASVKGAVFNFTVAVIGPGLVAIPFAFKESGLLLGMALAVLCACFAFISLRLLIVATSYLPPSATPSYHTLSQHAGGSNLVVLTQFNLLLSLFGSVIVRLAAAGGVLVTLYDSAFGIPEGHHFDDFYLYIVMVVTVVIIFPLSLCKASSLRFTSMCSVLCFLFISLCLVVQYITKCHWVGSCFWSSEQFITSLVERGHSRLINLSTEGLLTAFPLLIFAYKCQPNVFSIVDALKSAPRSESVATATASTARSEQSPGTHENTPSQSTVSSKSPRSDIDKVFVSSLTISMTMYMAAGSAAFLLLFEDTKGNVLQSDFGEAPEILMASLIFAVSMLLAVPVFVNVLRENLMDIISLKTANTSTSWKVALTIMICAICAAVTALCGDVSTVFGIMGSTTNPVTGYFLPTYFVWKMVPEQEAGNRSLRRLKWSSLVMSAVILLISIGSLYIKMVDVFSG